MDKVNRWVNAVVMILVIAAFGYLVFKASKSKSGSVAEIAPPDDPWFRTEVLESPEPVIVKFGAAWCGPCRKLDPELDRLASDGRVKVVKIDIDDRPDLSRHFGVSSIPDVYLFNKGAAVAHQRGYTIAEQLRRWIDGHLSK